MTFSIAASTDAALARQGGAAHLAQALQASRADTLATFAAWRQALPDLRVPQRGDLNPPLWELGHIGWFADHWLARNPQRELGSGADPFVGRLPPARSDVDALYDSSQVPHDSRWSLPLPDTDQTERDLAHQLERSLNLLDAVPATDHDRLYFHRLCLLHEDMHHEAALYMAQALGVAISDPRWQASSLPEPPAALTLPAQRTSLGSAADAGFAFDNELAAHPQTIAATRIDAQVVRWAEFLPAVHAGAVELPRYLRQAEGQGSGWQHWRHGRWQALDLTQAACHLSYPQAQAWCRWAGRRLPSEVEWEFAACSLGPAFAWGQVWEWTASPFAPYPGFAPHPYRDYSAPWFDGRPVLRGASFMTQPRMRHPRYRNFFAPQRNDIAAGFRSCAC